MWNALRVILMLTLPQPEDELMRPREAIKSPASYFVDIDKLIIKLNEKAQTQNRQHDIAREEQG